MFCPRCRTQYSDEATKCSVCGAALVPRLEDIPETSADKGQVGSSIVFVTSNIHEANLVKGLLEANGLQGFLFDDNILRLNPLYVHAVGGIKIAVSTSQLAQAQQILEEYRAKEGMPPYAGQASPFTWKKEEEKRTTAEKESENIEAFAEQVKCPQCGADCDPDSSFCNQCGKVFK